MKNIKKYSSLLILVVLIGASFYYYDKNLQENNSLNKKENLGVLPDFIMADVVSLEGQLLKVMAGPKESTVFLSQETIIIQQVSSGNGYKNITGSISDIKPGQRIVIFYRLNSQNQYMADKVQILNF